MNTTLSWEEKERRSKCFLLRTTVCTTAAVIVALFALCYVLHLFKHGYLDRVATVEAKYESAAKTVAECERFSEHSRVRHKDACEQEKSIWMAGRFWLYVDEVVRHFVSDMGGDFFVMLYHQSPFGLALLLAGVGTIAVLLWNHGPTQAWRLMGARNLADQEAVFARQLFGAALCKESDGKKQI